MIRTSFHLAITSISLGLVAIVSSPASATAIAEPPTKLKRVVFLGDSITYAGHYITYVESALRCQNPGMTTEFLNIGLPSETVSGLSEPGHAGGAFPRPTLHERLDRVIEKSKPDMIIACYGMNDGIYYPYGEDRFERYKAGIVELRKKAAKVGIKVLHLTPPVFDSQPILSRTLPAGRSVYEQPYVGYDDVLDRYSQWLVSKRAKGWDVIDIRTPIKAYLDNQRREDPKFRLAGDGVHMDTTGHWLIAREVLKHWGFADEALKKAASGDAYLATLPQGQEVLKLVTKRQAILRDAWLNHAGHKRPGMAKGKSIADAERDAKEIETKLRALVHGS